MVSSGINQVIERRGRWAGIEVNPHKSRHHFSRTFLGRGGAEGELMELNGWVKHPDARPVRRSTLSTRAAVPAQVVTSLSETLQQTPPAVALLGDETAYTGPDHSMVYHWFTRPDSPQIYQRYRN